MRTTAELDFASRVLERTPGSLDALLRGLPGVWTRSAGERQSWRAFDILGHLVHCEQEDWLPRARIILEVGEKRAFEPFDRLAQFEASKGKTLEHLLDEFAALRRGNLEALGALELGDEDLARAGRHPELGRVTLGELLSAWVAHDLSHVAQIARTLARASSGDVGAWRAYLPILGPDDRQSQSS